MGPTDAQRRGRGGLFHSQIANDPNPVAPAMVRAAKSIGIPSFDDINGAMMEGPGGCGLAQHTIKDGQRHSVAKVYLHPVMAQSQSDGSDWRRGGAVEPIGQACHRHRDDLAWQDPEDRGKQGSHPLCGRHQ